MVRYLALSALTAVAVAEWRANAKRGIPVVLVVAVAVIADYLPAPFPLISLNHPAVYDELRDRAEAGAVCELPLGLRDGFGQQGAFDDGVLFYQTIHQRPMVGGFVARLSRTVTDAYENDPLLAGLVSLSARAVDNAVALPDRQLASTKLRENRIRFIVLNRHRASSNLIAYVEGVLPLTLVAEHDGRSLYIVSE